MIFKIGFLFLCTVVAFWISAICGGGASLILIPILAQLLSSSAIPVSLTIGTFTSSASRIYFFRKHIKWYMFFWFVHKHVVLLLKFLFLKPLKYSSLSSWLLSEEIPLAIILALPKALIIWFIMDFWEEKIMIVKSSFPFKRWISKGNFWWSDAK